MVQRHVLRTGDLEREEVVRAFMSTMCRPSFKKKVDVVKVERIQNFSMWQTYIMKRQVGWKISHLMFPYQQGYNFCHTHTQFTFGCILDYMLP